MLKNNDIKTKFPVPTKIQGILLTPMDKVHLQQQGIYEVKSEYAYIINLH